ncbi:MAG: hypothetical protein AB7P20_03370 [Rhizobiaceae bacterium]
MDHIATIAFVFLVGVTLCGIFGSVLELAAGARLSFAAPFFDHAHRLRFVLAVITAGPLMLCNDTAEAWREGRLGALAFAGCAVTVLFWTLAIGVTGAAAAMRMVLAS